MNISLLCLILTTSARRVSFTAFGDWGLSHSGSLKRISAQLSSLPVQDFSILLGDNFYSKGVESINDPKFALFDLFKKSANQFFVIPGNHDYDSPNSVQYQIEYSQREPKWIFPAPYYSKRLDLGNGYSLCMIFLDTEQFMKQPAQQQWLIDELQSCQGTGVFRIVSGHYPIYSVGTYNGSSSVKKIRNYIQSVITQYNVHLYLSGHEHQLQAFENLGCHFIISGAIAYTKQHKIREHTEWSSMLKFADNTQEGFVQVEIEKNELSYKFLGSDRTTLYSNSLTIDPVVHVPVGVSTTTERSTFDLTVRRPKDGGEVVSTTTQKSTSTFTIWTTIILFLCILAM